MKGNLLYLPNYLIIMKTIEKESKPACEIKRITKISYAHILLIKKTLLSLGWIIIKKNENKKEWSLTELGLKIVNKLNEMLDLMGLNFENYYMLKQKDKVRGR